MPAAEIEQQILLPASAERVFLLLMESEQHSDFTGAEAVIDPVVGGHYSAYDGYITGITLALIPNQYIKQTWVAHDDTWPPEHVSEVEFMLTPLGENTVLTFRHTHVPESRLAEFDAAWHDFYWNPLKTYLS